MEPIPYYHTLDIMSVDDLIKTSVFNDVAITKNIFLEFVVDGKSNHRRLFDNLTIEQRRAANTFFAGVDYNSGVDYLVTNGVLLYIPVDKIKVKYKYESNITVTQTRPNEYFPPILRALTNDPGYISAELDRGNNGQQIYPKFTAWLWSRSKYLENTGNKGFVNITEDIINLNIDSALGSGATFSIDLAAIQCKWSLDVSQNKEGWQPIRENDKVSQASLNRHFTNKDIKGYTSESLRNLFYYEMIANENDMIFISFEKLKIDGYPSIDDVHDKWYDLIGLIDNTTKSINVYNGTVDVVINIRGRDLTKAIMDDNSYFNPYSRGHINSIYGGDFGANDRFINGKFGITSAYLNKTIQQSIEFIIGRIATIGYVPDDIISHFTSISQVVKTDNEKRAVKGIWQLCKVFIDPALNGLRVVDDNVSNPDGSILDLFNKIAQKPFVELITDTYGDKFYFIFRQPPFTKQALLSAFTDVSDLDINPDFTQYKTISDQPSGAATKDQINKYKQIQSQFGVREKDLVSKDNENIFQTSEGLNVEVVSEANISFNRIINISDKDVLGDTLRNCNESYAWYQITDRGNFAGLSVNLGVFPALYFDIYAQTFGNKRLEVISNYSDYRFFNDQNNETQLNLYADQAAQHLAFLVETNAYLPFTRMGTITINGDRRIKKGNWIYYRPTGEVCYVTDVSNQASIAGSIDRTTTVTVERCMLIDYLKQKPEIIIDQSGNTKTINVSYFNIVDIDKLRKDTYDVIAKGNVVDKFDYKKNMIVNEDVFNFFLQKRNFKKLSE